MIVSVASVSPLFFQLGASVSPFLFFSFFQLGASVSPFFFSFFFQLCAQHKTRTGNKTQTKEDRMITRNKR